MEFDSSSPQRAADDCVLPFQVDSLDVRGRIVRLGPAVDAILRRHAYPPEVSRALAEAIALTLLVGTALKFDGRLIVQTRTDGPLRMMVADFKAPDRIRACATFDAEAVADALANGRSGTIDLLGKGYLAMTVDQGASVSRYQGVVTLSGESLEDAADQYFRQSEQVPTRVRLAVAEHLTAHGAQWRAGGAMVQYLPSSPDSMRTAELPDNAGPRSSPEDDAWLEAEALLDTVEHHELTDPMLASETLLYRLFPEREVRVHETLPIIEKCRCSREAVSSMLHNFSAADRRDMIADDGRISVTCEFCNTVYVFDPGELHIEAP